jgi:hypothetical protein
MVHPPPIGGCYDGVESHTATTTTWSFARRMYASRSGTASCWRWRHEVAPLSCLRFRGFCTHPQTLEDVVDHTVKAGAETIGDHRAGGQALGRCHRARAPVTRGGHTAGPNHPQLRAETVRHIRLTIIVSRRRNSPTWRGGSRVGADDRASIASESPFNPRSGSRTA